MIFSKVTVDVGWKLFWKQNVSDVTWIDNRQDVVVYFIPLFLFTPVLAVVSNWNSEFPCSVGKIHAWVKKFLRHGAYCDITTYYFHVAWHFFRLFMYLRAYDSIFTVVWTCLFSLLYITLIKKFYNHLPFRIFAFMSFAIILFKKHFNCGFFLL